MGLNCYVNQLDIKQHCHIFIMAIQFYLINDAHVHKHVFSNLMFSQPFNFGDQNNQEASIMNSCRADIHYIMFCMDKAL